MTALRLVLVLLLLGGAAGSAEARPGGGDSFSGGGGHGGGGSGDGGGGDGGDVVAAIELILRLVGLCIDYPKIGIPVTLLVVGVFVYAAYQNEQIKDWDSGPPIELKRAVSLAPLRDLDPDFSPILFEDFVYRLYATCHQMRHEDHLLEALAPYVAKPARERLAARQPRGQVTGVVIGAMRPRSVTPARHSSGRSLVSVEFEANYTAGGRTWYVVERWMLARAASARTRPRDLAKGFPCPNCGAPWEASRTHDVQRCSYCDQIVDNGRFDWQVVDVRLVRAIDKPPTLTHEVPERGTTLATYRDPNVDVDWRGLVADDPALSRESLDERLRVIYERLYAAWDAGDLGPARRYLSDGLYDYLTYWIIAYNLQGLRNRLENMRLTKTELAKVHRDRWYDAVTLRIWGTGRDYVIKKDTGTLVRGSRKKERFYSEYWTLIRSSKRRGPTRTDGACENCGAPAPVAMTGACEHCGAHVTSGEFDWVLSKIEQDDSYRG